MKTERHKVKTQTPLCYDEDGQALINRYFVFLCLIKLKI